MSEEENKAIELIGCLNLNESYIITSKQWNEQDVHKAIDILLNLIEKLKKEIEEYKLLNANIEKANRIIEGKEEYIPKNKIREKLEKIEKEKEQYYAAGQHLMYMLLKNQLKSLLEEE